MTAATQAWVEPPTARQSAAARRRRTFHEDRIAGAPEGTRRRTLYVIAWLQAEVAAGGDLQRLISLAGEMNGQNQ